MLYVRERLTQDRGLPRLERSYPSIHPFSLLLAL